MLVFNKMMIILNKIMLIFKKKVNALDIGVINDGKTDCSEIINSFLSNKKNKGKTLYISKGEYFINKGIVFHPENKIKLVCEDAVFYGDNSEDSIGIKVVAQN